jgi:hypothetical protein
VVTEAHVDALVLAQPIGSVVSSDAQAGHVDHDMQRVQVM